MKKSILMGMLALAGLSLTSCDDFLNDNRYPEDQETNSPLFWSNESNVQQEINTLYNYISGYGQGNILGEFYFQTLSDDQADTPFKNWANTNVPASSTNWTNPYTHLRHILYILEGVNGSSLDEKVRNNYAGIARLMRAIETFGLVKCYGDVVWIDKVVDVADNGILYGPRQNRDEVMDLVLQDLNFAVANISKAKDNMGFSRDMALAVKSEICLWEGTFCKYRTVAENGYAADETRASKFLNECANAAGELINSGRYQLNSSYKANYNSVLADMKANPEMILFKGYADVNFMHSTEAYTCTSTPIKGLTKNAFEAYLFKDGKPLALTSEDKSDVGEVDANGNYSIAKLLAVRDNRLAETTDPVVYYTGMGWSRAKAMSMTSTTGYGVSKFDNTALPVASRQNTTKNYICAPIYWISAVYCDYAEAKAELGTITDADLDLTVNKLYNRAQLPAVTVASLSSMNDPANNMGVNSLIWEIRRCRRCELIMDRGYRYWDLVRWHQLDKLDSGKYPDILLGANMTAAPVSISNVGGYVNATFNMVRTYESRQYLYPIPQNQLNLNPNLRQNQGW